MAYQLVDKASELARIVDHVLTLKPRIGVDTETQGLRPEIGHRIIGASISLGSDREKDLHLYVPVRHSGYVNIDPAKAWEILRPVFQHSEIEKVFFNGKFDLKMFRMDGEEFAGPVHDAILMAHLLEQDNEAKRAPGHAHGKLSLKYLGETKLGEPPADEKVLTMHLLSKFPTCKNIKEKMEFSDPNICCQYACTDTRLTLRLDDHYRPRLDPSGLRENYEAEVEVMRGLVDTELRGIPVNREFLQRKTVEIEKREDALLVEVRGESRLPLFNPNSGLQVYGLITDILGLKMPEAERTKTGKVSLKDETLEMIDHPLVKKIAEYRSLQKMRSTFFLGLQEWITDKECVHPNLFQVGTPTARFSCREPNLQNQPEELRPAFLVRPNFRSWRWDYSQIEMRIFSHYSGDALLVDGYRSGAEFDIHGAIAKELGIPRKAAKTTNFAIIYGAGVKRLAANLGISEQKAKAFLESYYGRFPGIKKLRNLSRSAVERRASSSKEVLKWGYVKDEFGRFFYMDPKNSYLAVNRLIQGCAANLMKRGMARAYRIIGEMRKEFGPDAATLLVNIHDEIEIEIRKDVPAEETWVPRITRAMEDFPQFRIPIRADCKVSDTTWAEAKPYEVRR